MGSGESLDKKLENSEQIKCDLRKIGSSLAKISRELGVTCATVSIVNQGHKRSRRVEDAIAQKLGTTPEKLYPDRYEQTEGRL